MRITNAYRTVLVTVNLEFEDAETLTLTLIDGTKVHPLAMQITYGTGSRRTSWKMSTLKLKTDGTVGKASKEIGDHSITGWNGDLPVPQWITDLVEAHRPRVDLATV